MLLFIVDPYSDHIRQRTGLQATDDRTPQIWVRLSTIFSRFNDRRKQFYYQVIHKNAAYHRKQVEYNSRLTFWCEIQQSQNFVSSIDG